MSFQIAKILSKVTSILAVLESAAGLAIAPKTLSPANDTVEAGLYEATTLHAVDADLATANIKAGKTIFGIAGKAEVLDTTQAADFVIAGRMKTGDIAYVNGSKITGDGTKTLDPDSETVQAGYYAATTLSAVDVDLAATNIAVGKTIFGFIGSFSSDANAVAGDIALGKTAYVNGVKITGTHE